MLIRLPPWKLTCQNVSLFKLMNDFFVFMCMRWENPDWVQLRLAVDLLMGGGFRRALSCLSFDCYHMVGWFSAPYETRNSFPYIKYSILLSRVLFSSDFQNDWSECLERFQCNHGKKNLRSVHWSHLFEDIPWRQSLMGFVTRNHQTVDGLVRSNHFMIPSSCYHGRPF